MASKLGTSTGYITKLGDDPFADYLLDSWRTEGVDTSAVKVVPGFTGVHFLSILPGGEREFVYYREGTAATTLAPDDLDPEYIAAAEVLHVSAVPQAISPSARATVLWAAQVARERSVTVSFDTKPQNEPVDHRGGTRGSTGGPAVRGCHLPRASRGVDIPVRARHGGRGHQLLPVEGREGRCRQERARRAPGSEPRRESGGRRPWPPRAFLIRRAQATPSPRAFSTAW